MPLQVRRGSTADRTGITPLSGELIWDESQSRLYVGDGDTAGGVAAASYTTAEAQDAAAEIFTTGSHTGISFSYNSLTKQISAVTETPDLSNYTGTIGADAFKGSFFGDDSTIIIDGVLNSVNLEQTIRSNVIPFSTESYDIGSSGLRFKDIYLSGTINTTGEAIYIGDALIGNTGTQIDLPANSTVGGNTIASLADIVVGSGVVEGSNYAINIIADDSTMLVNSATSEHYGTFKGSLFGEDSSQIIDGHSGVITGTLFQGPLITTQTITTDSIEVQFINSASGLKINDSNQTRLNTNSLLIFPDKNTSSRMYVYSQSATGFGTGLVTLSNNHDNVYTDDLAFTRARGNNTTPAIAQNGDKMGGMIWTAWDGSSYQTAAGIDAYVDGPISSNNNYGCLKFRTRNGLISTIGTAMEIAPDKTVKYNTYEALTGDTVTLNSFFRLPVSTAAPASPTNGDVGIADGSSWDPLGVPGKQQMVVFLGGGWRQIAVEP